MDVPTYHFLGLEITEPFTWITNWLIAAFVLGFGHLLFRDKNADITQKFWSFFFVFIGLASLIGGIAHGFINYVGHNFHYAAWIFAGMAVFSAELATIQLIENEKLKATVRLLIYVQLLVMTISVMYLQDFNSVRINSAVGLVGVVIPISIYHYLKNKDKRSILIIIGILSNLIPGIIHAFKISYNEWFNFNDVSHIVMIFCFYVLYKGAKQNTSIDLTKNLSKVSV